MKPEQATHELPRHTLIMCYDKLVNFAGANRTNFIDTHYASWFIRQGEVRLDWAGGGIRVRGGNWIFCDPTLRRSQRFGSKTRMVSIRVQISWAGGSTICLPASPLVVRANKLPGLLPAAEALVTAHHASRENNPGSRIISNCQEEARFQDWLVAWYSARTQMNRGPIPPAARDARLEKILQVLRQESSRDSIPYEKLKTGVGLSRAQIDRLFREAFGVTPRQWCDRSLHARAEHLLARKTLSIKQISHQLGFVDPSHFGKWFRKFSRMSPLTFRRGDWGG